MRPINPAAFEFALDVRTNASPFSVARDEQMFLALERARAWCLVTDLISQAGTP